MAGIYIPTMLNSFVDYLEIEKISLNLKGIYIAGDVLKPEIIRKAKNNLNGTAIYSAYGMTEIAPISIKQYDNEDENEELTGVEKLMEGIQIKIIPQKEESKSGSHIGEICIKHSMIEMERYSSDGWFHTGDIGYLAQGNELFLCGRLKNMLIRNGLNVFPEMVERKIVSSKLVKEAVVFMDNSKLVSNIVVENREKFEIFELLKFCKENLDSQEIPCDFRIVEAIEKNESMKIVRNRPKG